MIYGFDSSYYLSVNSDVKAAGIDPSTHYETYGQREGRNPNSHFDESYYRSHNPDVDAAIKAGVFSSGYSHFTLYGHSEGRSPDGVFNENAYLAINTDVAQAVHAGYLSSGWQHYISYGATEHREGATTGTGTISVGTSGNDSIQAYAGYTAIGLEGNDTITGSDLNTRLSIPYGDSNIYGGRGADVFNYVVGNSQLFSTSLGTSHIFDFSHAEGDKIHISNADGTTPILSITHSTESSSIVSIGSGSIQVDSYISLDDFILG